ncbi:MAG TPA: ParB/RepB/Spo0J family partition protein [Streptosporangiaceae bacterium]|nr:ParB/RepB/Spo0J family partition protein [Streptosporangiaceae bacterium]
MNAPTEHSAAADVQPAEAVSPEMAADPQPETRSRLMIPVGDLIAHHGNVREDLNLTEEFLASVAVEGVRIPLLITTAPGGGWRVIEGHRRLAAALQTNLAAVPCDIDPSRANDEAGQYVDMLLANSDSYRANYTILEETAALFAAHEAGASRTRLRKATGRTPAQVKAALAVGGLSAGTRARAAELGQEMTLEDLALLAEFDGNQDATDRLLSCIDYGYPLEHAAQRIRQDRVEAAEHARIRADLEAAGITITDQLPDGAAWLDSLTHDGADLTPDTHAACRGHSATFRSWNLLHPAWYCTSPADHGHASRWQLGSPTAGTGSDTASTPGTTGSQPDPAQDPGRRLVITGNKAWQAAADVRHRWITTNLFPRKSAPREASVFLARQLLAMPSALTSGLSAATTRALFTQLTGHDQARWLDSTDTAQPGRLVIIMLAPVITAYEEALSVGEGRNTWRTDRYSPCPRADAGTYLAFLASLGYQLSAIEQAVVDGISWRGDTTLASLLAPEPPEDDAEPGRDVGKADPASDEDADSPAQAS